MVPTPVVVGLSLCNYVLAEEGGMQRVSIIGSFSRLRVASFPAAYPFYLFATLTDGNGPASMEFNVSRLDTLEEIYSRADQIRFPGRTAVVNVYYPVRRCVFPVQGWYQASLLLDGEWVAQRRLHLSAKENVQ